MYLYVLSFLRHRLYVANFRKMALFSFNIPLPLSRTLNIFIFVATKLKYMYNPIHHFDDMQVLPDMSKLTQKEKEEVRARYALYGCSAYAVGIILVIIICFLIGSCSTSKEVSSVEYHRVENLMQRMDSVINTRQVIRQDSSWRELIMHQFQSLRERNDTSHTVVVDTAGRVISERIIIRTERESNSETDRQERQVLIHRLEVMDSTLTVMQQQFSHIDSLMQAKNTTITRYTQSTLTSWQQVRLWLANVVLVALFIAAAVWAWRKRAWWLRLFRK